MGVWLALGIAALALGVAFSDDEAGLRSWWSLRGDLARAEERVAELRGRVEALERHAGGLEEDPFALERAIRERLEWARPGETVVRLSPRGSANPRIP